MSNIHFKNTSTNIENCISASSNFSSSEKGLSYLPNLPQENVLTSQQLQEALKERQEKIDISAMVKFFLIYQKMLKYKFSLTL